MAWAGLERKRRRLLLPATDDRCCLLYRRSFALSSGAPTNTRKLIAADSCDHRAYFNSTVVSIVVFRVSKRQHDAGNRYLSDLCGTFFFTVLPTCGVLCAVGVRRKYAPRWLFSAGDLLCSYWRRKKDWKVTPAVKYLSIFIDLNI